MYRSDVPTFNDTASTAGKSLDVIVMLHRWLYLALNIMSIEVAFEERMSFM